MEHFTNNDFVNEKTKNIKKNAVPQKYKELQFIKVLTPTKTYDGHPHFPETSQTPEYKKQQDYDDFNKITYLPTPTKKYKNTDNTSSCSTSDLTPKTKLLLDSTRNLPSPSTQLLSSPQPSSKKSLFKIVNKLENTIKNQKNKLKNKRSSISKLRNNLLTYKSKYNNHNILDSLHFPSKESKTLVKMQVSRKKKTTKTWATDEKNLALSIFYKSPSTYKFLRISKNINLPAESSLKRWIGNSKFKTGFNPNVFKQLKIKADTMDEQERYCTLVFDEMKIKNFLEYSKYLDLVEGYEDLGPLGRSNKLAGQAMVFLIRGLYASWKLPISYFFAATSVKHTDLSILLKDVIEKLLDCGFIVTAMICDQGKNNIAALVNDLKMTKNAPFIEVKGKQIYSIFDVPHLFKNLRNNFKSNNFIFKGKETSFKDLKDVYEIDKKSGTSRALLKITDSHMNPGPFQLMSCKLAMQLFSNSMAAAMETCIMSKQLQSNTALNTLDMIKELNHLLDVLNSKSLFDKNSFKCAISQERPQQLEFLLKTKSWLANLKKVKSKCRQEERPPCFDGLMWTINSIEMIYNQQKELGYNYLLTNRLTSDVIENTFSVFRQRGGYNRYFKYFFNFNFCMK